MKKIYLLLALCVSTLAAQADVYEVALANAQWNFDAVTDYSTDANYKKNSTHSSNTSCFVPANWCVDNESKRKTVKGSSSYIPFACPNNYALSSNTTKFGMDGDIALKFYHNAGSYKEYAMLPRVSDKDYKNLELVFYARKGVTDTEKDYASLLKIGYISSLADTANFFANVNGITSLTVVNGTESNGYTKYTISLKDVPNTAYIAFFDSTAANNMVYLDNISFKEVSGSTPTTPATPASYTISYNLTGCTAASANKATVTAEDNELDLFFDLADGFSWSGCTYEVKMGATTLDAETDYLADVDEEQFNIYIYLISGKFNGNITVTLTAKANAAITRPTVFAPATFEDITIATNSVYRPATFSVGHNQWLSGSFICNTYMGSASYFSDIQVANYAGSFTPSGSDEYLACAAGCAAQGNNYAIWNASMDYTTYAANNQQIDLCVPTTLSGMAITCDEHAVNSILNGDSYCTKFKQDDWFMVKIIGWNSGVQTGNIDFYLADFRTAGNWVIAENWQWVNLTTLGVVDHLSFEMYSTDTSYGYMNTPAYFCFDNLGGQASDCTLGAMTKVGGTATNLDNINESIVEKLLLNNQVVIRRGDKLYNVSGQLIR